MFRLLKLAFVVAVGYAMYDFFQGVRASGGLDRARSQPARRGRSRAMSQSNPQNITGPGKGRRVEVDAGDEGAGQSEYVGRGVVRR